MQVINKKLFYLKIICLILIFGVGFIVRLYRFNGPIADWFSWRQADTSAVSRNFVTEGFDLLHPKFDDLSNVPSGLDNPLGYRFVEFPIYNIFQAGLFKIVGYLTIEEWGRIVTISFSLLSALFLFLIVKRRSSFLSGILTSFFYLFLPFNIYFSRIILPDPLMVTFILGGIYFFDLWVNNDLRLRIYDSRFLAALSFTILAFLIKPFAAFFILPMVYLVYEKFGLDFVKKWQLWIFAIFSLLPFGLWRLWMLQYPAGIPQSSWLFNGNNIRFKGAFFNWIFARRIAELILGFWGLPIFIMGIIAKHKKNLFFLSFIFSSLAYVTIVATGNVQHDYYQIPLIPTIAIFLGLGSAFLINPPKEYVSRFKTVLILIVCVLFMFSFSWFEVRDFFNINDRSIIIAGQAVDSMTPKNAKVIALYGGDTSFLYQTKRKGWASFEKPLPELIRMGADYLVIANPKSEDYGLGKTYRTVSQTSQYILFNLRQQP